MKSDVVMVGQVKLTREKWNQMSNLEKSRLFLDNRERTEISPDDVKGLSPAEIELLELELKEYLEHKEVEKIESDRLRSDKAQISQTARGHHMDTTWLGYYQRQILLRMEAFNESRKRNPLRQEPKSSQLHPYQFQAELTEWNSLEQASNICRSNVEIKQARLQQYHSVTGRRMIKAKWRQNRQVLLREQYLSGEALVNLAPSAVQPYLRLSRYDKPIGYQLLFVPGMLGLLSGTQYGVFPDLSLIATFAAGTLLTRGAGCTINDYWDHKYDAQVERCKSRPIPSGQVSTDKAKVWFVVQMAAAFGLLSTLNWTTFCLGLAAPLPIILYPLAKRLQVSHQLGQTPASLMIKPQIALGLTFNWGALMGYSAITDEINLAIQLPLYFGCVAWTVLYDTIYARQDLKDDLKLKLNTSANLSELIPPNQRAKRIDYYTNYRARQERFEYQQQIEYRFLNMLNLAMLLGLTMAYKEAEKSGKLFVPHFDVAFWSVVMAVLVNWLWMQMGTEYGKASVTSANLAKQYFMKQKWVGAYLIALYLFWSGALTAFIYYDENNRRVYPMREVLRELASPVLD